MAALAAFVAAKMDAVRVIQPGPVPNPMPPGVSDGVLGLRVPRMTDIVAVSLRYPAAEIGGVMSALNIIENALVVGSQLYPGDAHIMRLVRLTASHAVGCQHRLVALTLWCVRAYQAGS